MPAGTPITSIEDAKNLARNIFRDFDHDHNCFLDMPEFIELMKQFNPNLTDDEATKLFEEVDLDGGGAIEENEFLEWYTTKWLNETGQVISQESAAKLQRAEADLINKLQKEKEELAIEVEVLRKQVKTLKAQQTAPPIGDAAELIQLRRQLQELQKERSTNQVYSYRRCSQCSGVKEASQFGSDAWVCKGCDGSGCHKLDRYKRTVVDVIGHTPMVQLNRLVEGLSVGKVLIKVEMQNPGGSVKDRIAKSMIEDAEAQGLITPGKTTIIEYTSGNTGIGLCMVSAAKGYRCIIVMPQVPAMKERYMVCRKFGAAVHLTAACKGIKGAEAYVNQMVENNPDYWCPRQFMNPSNQRAHLETTGPEIWEQTGGDIDYLVAGAGTGGTVTALAKYFKAKNPNIKIVLIEPSESRVLVGQKHTPHTIVGIGAGFPLPFVEELAPGQEWKEGPRGLIDEFAHCNGTEAINFADLMAAKEGLLVGPTSGAAVKVALDIAQRPEAAGKTIVVICASSAIRYTTHPLWASLRTEGDNALPAPANMEPEPLLRWASPEHDV